MRFFNLFLSLLSFRHSLAPLHYLFFAFLSLYLQNFSSNSEETGKKGSA